MFKRWAIRALAALWPFAAAPVARAGWRAPLGRSRRPGQRWPWYVVCGHPDRLLEVDAPAPLHLVLRLALWPFALADWALCLLDGLWSLPDYSGGWPPLP